MSGRSAEIAALQDALAGEHAAVYVYGVLGAQTSQSAQAGLYEGLTAAFLVHRERRDDLIDTIGGLGARPVAADPAYQVPDDLSSASLVERVALKIERGCAAAYAYAVANTTAANRTWAVGALIDAARREVGFGGTPQTLPGL